MREGGVIAGFYGTSSVMLARGRLISWFVTISTVHATS